jgi:hypothetical protein
MTGAEAVSLIASIATIVAAMAVVVTAAIYWRQLKTMTKTRETESILAIMPSHFLGTHDALSTLD